MYFISTLFNYLQLNGYVIVYIYQHSHLQNLFASRLSHFVYKLKLVITLFSHDKFSHPPDPIHIKYINSDLDKQTRTLNVSSLLSYNVNID